MIAFSMRSSGSLMDHPVSSLTRNGTIVEQITNRHRSTTVGAIWAALPNRLIVLMSKSGAAFCASPISIMGHSIG
jgi:hypothetical protein